MHVQVQHKDPLHGPLQQELSSRHRDVVQEAEPGATVWEGVVGAPRSVDCQAVLQSQAGPQKRPCPESNPSSCLHACLQGPLHQLQAQVQCARYQPED